MMPIVGLGLVLFALAFVLHIVRWRIATPSGTARALVLTFVLGISGGLGLVLVLARIHPAVSAFLPPDVPGLLLALILALAFAAAYVMTYPAIEVESPTLAMVQAIGRRGEEGLARSTLFEQLNDEVLIAPRVRDLLIEGLAIEQNGRLYLSEQGRRLVGLFLVWRRLLGAREGG